MRRVITLGLPFVALLAAWLLLFLGRPRVWALVPGERLLGAAVVLTLALGALVSVILVTRPTLVAAPRLRVVAGSTFGALVLVFMVAQGLVGRMPTEPGAWHAEWTHLYGPLVTWPTLYLSVPAAGVYMLLPLGRSALLVATAAGIAAGGALSLQHWQQSRRAGAAAAPLAAGTTCALATTACAACLPPVFAASAAFGMGAPWLVSLVAPGGLAAESLLAAAPVLGLGAVVLAAKPTQTRTEDDEDRSSGRRTAWLVAGLLAAGVLISLPFSAWTPMTFGSSARARDISALYQTVHVAGLAVLFAFEFLLVGLVVHSRRRRSPDARPPTRGWRTVATTTWIVVPVLVLLLIAVPGFLVLYEHGQNAPEDSYDVRVQAVNWGWIFEHPDGERTLDHLEVPEGASVRLLLNSTDVIHGFYVPELGVKQDAVPGRDNEAWFLADTPGQYRGACAEFCGIGHPTMDFVVTVLPEEN